MTLRNLVVSGGPLHDFAATTDALVALAAKAGVESVVPADPGAALDQLADGSGWDLVTVNALLWRMPAERHAALRDGWRFSIDDHQADGLLAHVARGGGLLACHTAPICFDGDERWRSLLGATWDGERSHHPPCGPARIEPTGEAGRHPITAGVASFDLTDEIYAALDVDDDLAPLLTSDVDGVEQPVLWARHVARGRVVVSLLGHGQDTYEHPVFAELVGSALRWLVADEETR